MRRLIMAAVIIASFVPSYVFADSRSEFIEEGQGLINTFLAEKIVRCNASDKQKCERTYDAAINSIRDGIEMLKQQSLAMAKGDTAEVRRLQPLILLQSQDIEQKGDLLRREYPKIVTVGSKN